MRKMAEVRIDRDPLFFLRHLLWRVIVFLLLIIILLLPIVAAKAQSKKKPTALPEVTPILWKDPGDISSLDLYYGQGKDGWDPLESTCRHASLSIL